MFRLMSSINRTDRTTCDRSPSGCWGAYTVVVVPDVGGREPRTAVATRGVVDVVAPDCVVVGIVVLGVVVVPVLVAAVSTSGMVATSPAVGGVAAGTTVLVGTT